MHQLIEKYHIQHVKKNKFFKAYGAHAGTAIGAQAGTAAGTGTAAGKIWGTGIGTGTPAVNGGNPEQNTPGEPA